MFNVYCCTQELKERLQSKIEEEDEKQRDEPPRKIAKQASGEPE